MKKLLITLIVLITNYNYFNAQINIKTNNHNEHPTIETYDSLSNFNLNYKIINKKYQTKDLAINSIYEQFKQFIGQNIYILPLTEKKANFNKQWNIKDPKTDKLRGKYYTIDEFEFKIENYTRLYELDKIIFKLSDENKKKYKWEISYYSLDDAALLVGYYEKLRKNYVGNTFIYTGRAKGKGSQFIIEPSLDHSAIDTKTQQIINLRNEKEWLCTDIQLIDDEITLQLYVILTNSEGNEIKARIENRFLFNNETNATFFSCFMKKNEYINWKESLIEKYNLDFATLIIEKKVKIGMSSAMCLESWGEPISKNKTILNGIETEQWIYKTNSYLYFDNGILTAIQN
ncbi:MAG: hypothetical protein IKV26_07145 [Paludibacteraceae bacterium]|nr:hypothetical protein [Paludibacteraceae bacterium]